jgi:ribosome-binding protein aMBF1 (putative translation factor)
MFRLTIKTAQDRNLVRSPLAEQGKLAVVVPVKRAKKKVSPRAATAVDAYIGTRMRDGRIALGLSQEALGEKLGVSFQQVQKYEKGVNRTGMPYPACNMPEEEAAVLMPDIGESLSCWWP